MNRFITNNKPYGKESAKQKEYERSLCNVTVEALLPLSLCETPAYRRHVQLLDSRILMVSRTRLTRKLIPDYYAEQKENVIDELKKVIVVALQFDLWMTKKTEEIFSLNANSRNRNIHLGMPYASGGTDSQSLSVAVKDCLDEFCISKKVESYTQDGGGNLTTYKRALDESVDNSDVFFPTQPIFEQECSAHVLQSTCKAAVVNVESNAKMVSVEKLVCDYRRALHGQKKP